MLPGISSPGFMTRFARCGNRSKTPELFAGMGIVGGNEPSNAILASGGSDNHFIFYNERCSRQRVATAVVCYGNIPNQASALCIESEQVSIESSHVQGIAQNRQ